MEYKINDVITGSEDVDESVSLDKWYLVIDRPYEGNENYLLKEITFKEYMKNNNCRLVFGRLPEHYVIQK